MEDLFFKVGFGIQFILVLIIYFHSASFYKSMSKMILATLASVSKSRSDLDFLVQIQRSYPKDKDKHSFEINKISDFLKAFNYENFTIGTKDDGIYVNIYDYNGKRILSEIELDYLKEDIDQTIKIAYFKSGEEISSKIQILPNKQLDKMSEEEEA